MPLIDIPPSQVNLEGVGIPAGVWTYWTPQNDPMFVPKGIRSNCSNLFADSPPTLLEAYQIVSLRVAYGFLLTYDTAGDFTSLDVEIDLLRGGQIIWAGTDTPAMTANANAEYGGGTIAADLVNPIMIGARDILSLRVGVRANGTANTATMSGVIAEQIAGIPSNAVPAESTITYNTLPVAARHRI